MSKIETRYGVMLDVENPDLSEIGLGEVYASLSKLCRFNGHCSKFYSVADHSVNCYLVAKELGFDRETTRLCLCHDFSEIIMGDIPTPAKKLLPDFCKLEEKIDGLFLKRFNLEGGDYDKMKQVDSAMARLEARYLMANRGKDFHCPPIKFRQEAGYYYGIERPPVCFETFLSYCEDCEVR